MPCQQYHTFHYRGRGAYVLTPCQRREAREKMFLGFFFPLLLRATLSPPNKLRSADKTFHLLGDIATVTGLHGAICEPPKRPLAEPKGKKNKIRRAAGKLGKVHVVVTMATGVNHIRCVGIIWRVRKR